MSVQNGHAASSSSSSSSSSPSSSELKNMPRVLLIRHGETDYNVRGIIQGQMDTPLNALGRKQAAVLGESLKDEEIDEIWCSPLSRAYDTAAAIHNRHSSPLPPLLADDRLKERYFGSLEGHSFRGEKTDAIAGIEKTAALAERVGQFWDDVVVRGGTSARAERDQVEQRHFYRTVVLVAHGASLSSLLNVLSPYALLGQGVKPSRLWNCSVTEVLLPSDLHKDAQSSNGTPVSESAAESEWQDMVAPRSPKEWPYKPGHLLGDLSRRSVSAVQPSLVITRWADIRHLEEENPPTFKTTSGEAEEKTGVSKKENADEMVLEEKDEVEEGEKA